MPRRLAVLVVPLLLLLAVPNPAAAASVPSSMAAIGDSITRGFDACGWFSDCPSRSWSTGSDTGVNSHYLRIRALNPAIAGHVFNDARSGADSAELLGQVNQAVGQHAGYVTILMGANDACGSSEADMTAVTTFRSRVDTALGALRTGLPNAQVLILSVPDLKRLWAIGRGDFAATSRWSTFAICPSMLANATSTSAANEARRNRVRDRVIAYNAELAAACTAYGPRCRFDNNALFNYQFVLSQISAWDYFHPNTTGQRVLASISWAVPAGS